MLANERLIFKMSTEQKIKLVTSTVMYENSPDDNYEFPVFKLSRNPLKGCEGFATQFPSDRALASTFNMPLVAEAYAKRGVETVALQKYSYFNLSESLKDEKISEDFYLTARTLASKAAGLLKENVFVNFEEGITPAVAGANLKDVIFSAAQPSSVLVRSVSDAEKYKKFAESGKLVFGVAKSADETLSYFLSGCTLVFTDGDYTFELAERLEKLALAYRTAYADYRSGELTLSELDRRSRALEIFDENILDGACDRLISALLKMRDGARRATVKSAINSKHSPRFDEVTDDALALTAARHSVVLLKNDGVLPLADTVPAAVVGEYAKNADYRENEAGGTPTILRLPFDAINNYDVNATGFANGYARFSKGRTDLINTAVELCKKSSAALVYLSAEPGERTLPEGQKELLIALYDTGVKVVAIVSADGYIDCSIFERCAAVLISFRAGQGETMAILDIIKGIATPSGRLSETFTRTGREGADYKNAPRSEVYYPFGFGLSYTAFAYSNLKVSERGISFTVENIGNYDGFCVPQLYVQKMGSEGIFKDKILRGFSKVFIKRREGVRVEIPFDENTFRALEIKGGAHRVEGGEYVLTVGENFFDERLTGKITLSEYVFKEGFSGEVVEKIAKGDASAVRFASDGPTEVKKAKREISFGVKLFVAILLTVYCEGVLATLMFTDIVSGKNTLFYCITGVLAAAFLVLFVIYTVVIAKKRKKQQYVPAGEVLTDLITNVGEFEEIAKVTYKEPLKPDEQEEEKGEEIAEDKEEEALAPAAAPARIIKSAGTTFGAVCENFKAFARSYGVGIDAPAIRAFLSAVAASKTVVIKSANAEVLPAFLSAVDAYFGGCGVTRAKDGWNSLLDVMRVREGEEVNVSGFANSLYTAVKHPEKLYAGVVSNVKYENLLKYFAPFLSFSYYPADEHKLKINGETTLVLPQNNVYVLSLADGVEGECPREVADAALRLDLPLSAVEKGERVAAIQLTPATLSCLSDESRENFYLSEKVWRKVDDLCEAVGFDLGNKCVLQLEKFTSALLECGADEGECIVLSLTSKIIPLLKFTSVYRKEGGEKTLAGVLEKLFGEEDMTKIQRSLAKGV